MTIRRLVSSERSPLPRRISRILLLSALAFLLIGGGNLACKKEAGEITEAETEEGALAAQEGLIAFEGTVKVAIGKYIFIPQVQGFDIVIQGNLDSGDIQILSDKEVRGEGKFSPENPSLLVADTVEIKDEGGEWTGVFTRSEEFVAEDYLDLHQRNEFEVLKDISYDEKEGWEEKEKAKVYGKLEKQTVAEGEGEKEAYNIVLFGEKGEEIGRILVGSFTDFSQYYIQKLSLFDKFCFYLSIKDTVDWKIRRRTRELFHADVLFAGLY